MREIAAADITETVRRLCLQGAVSLPQDVCQVLKKARDAEDWPPAKQILDTIIDNDEIAAASSVPICQDTGMVVAWLKVGQEVHINGDLTAAVDDGVRQAYTQGYLRRSVVSDPLRRHNSGDNCPALLTTELVPGDRVEISLSLKGFGSENMSQLKMLKPSDGRQGVVNFVLNAVKQAGPNPCPPIVIGVGIGGSFDKVAQLAKKALLRDLDSVNPDPYYRELEQDLLRLVNQTGIGPQGLGGRTTALAVMVETFPTHIAGLPCAVNINCHVSRHLKEVL
ncbi:fumarate hydratase [Oscillospiraceae bacterium HV4-5-C5C]|nr:fumarate hydratase [Oscillospiraceae bacterium HV4-5-C5C]